MIKYFNNTIGSIIEIINIILLPVFYNLKSKTFNKKILNIFFPIIIYAIVFLFQCNIFLIRGIQDILSEVHFSIALCLQLDYYIFLILTMIGVKYYMGLWGTGWLWSKKVTQYKSLKEQELKKSNPDIKYLKHLEDKISFYENKLNPVNNETNNF